MIEQRLAKISLHHLIGGDSKKFVDYRMAIQVATCLGDYVKKSMLIYGPKLTEKENEREKIKISHTLGCLMSESVRFARETIGTEFLHEMMNAASTKQPDIFQWLFTASLYQRSKNENIKITETDEWKHEDVNKEIERITDLLFSDSGKEMRPQLTGQALRIIASSITAVADMPDTEELNQEIAKIAKTVIPGSQIEGNEKIKKIVAKRMNRIKSMCDGIGEESKRVMAESSIGNPHALIQFVAGEVASQIHKAAVEIQEQRDRGF